MEKFQRQSWGVHICQETPAKEQYGQKEATFVRSENEYGIARQIVCFDRRGGLIYIREPFRAKEKSIQLKVANAHKKATG